ncbi:MAG: hypothetical protein PF961_02225 [Planctomycetota bacterium]|jgi:hypothetical protein|nr:hypothetical protein [Planctomycetota bacterium]
MHDHERIRALAGRIAEIAAEPVMTERRRAWTKLKDLDAERPMVLFETWTLGQDFLADGELQCQDPQLRGIERSMLGQIRQAEEIGDDLVVEPVWRLAWHTSATDYGVSLAAQHGTDAQDGTVGYHIDHPIRSIDDLDKLTPRRFSVDRAATEASAARLDAIFGDLLPVVIHGSGCLHSALTQDLFKLIGNDNLLLWPLDAPEALQRALQYLRDDRIAWFRFLEQEGLVGANANGTIVGSGSPGFVSELPDVTPAGGAQLKDCWTWMESQETTMISPGMFIEQFLPAMAEVASLFGLVYYGCCEPVHDRWDAIIKMIPNIRAVSISPWCDRASIAAQVGRSVVLSRKPEPPPISGATPNWDALETDLDQSLAAMGDCNLEFLFRDVYRINGDRPRLRRWVDLVRSRIGGAVLA